MIEEDVRFMYMLGQAKINYESEGFKIKIQCGLYGKDNYKYVLDKILELQEKGKQIHYTEYEKTKKK